MSTSNPSVTDNTPNNTQENSRMFIVESDQEPAEFETRANAVKHARSASRDTRRRVVVTRGGRLRMVYQGGELIEYEMDTRRRRR